MSYYIVNFNYLCTRQIEISDLKIIKMTTMSNGECRKRFKAANIGETPVHDFENFYAISGKRGQSVRDGRCIRVPKSSERYGCMGPAKFWEECLPAARWLHSYQRTLSMDQ